MAETEEPPFHSLAERIAALNQQKNFATPSVKPPPSRPPSIRPSSRTRRQSASPLANGDKQDEKPEVPPLPVRAAQSPAPALPARSNAGPKNGPPPLPSRSLAPPLPKRESAHTSPALPARRPSSQSLATRRNSNESVMSLAPTVSTLSLNPTIPGHTSSVLTDGRKLPPQQVPPMRRERDVSAAKASEMGATTATIKIVKAPLLPKRSVPGLVESDSKAVRPILPPRLPSRPSRSPDRKGLGEACPALPSRRLPPQPAEPVRPTPQVSRDSARGTQKYLAEPSDSGLPPVLVASRPKTRQIDMAQAKAAAQQPSYPCLVCRDFSGPDSVAAQHPASVVDGNDPTGYLAHVLCSPFPALTDKARAIFTWCHHNIDYDVDAFFAGCVRRGTASDTIFSGKAVCEGYARVYEAIAKRAGLQCIVVGGHGKGFGFTPVKDGQPPPARNATGHAWNAVRIDNDRWKLLDACWGAGSVSGQSYNRRFSPHHFTDSNEVFGISHFPEDSRYLFREDGRVPSWEEYVLGPIGVEGARWMSNAAEEGISEWQSKPAEKTIAVHRDEIVRFQFAKLCEHWTSERNGKGKAKLLMIKMRDGTPDDLVPLENDGFWWWCDIPSRDLGRSGQKVQLCGLDTLQGQDARGVTKSEWLSKRGTSAMTSWSWSIFCEWELV